MMVPSVRYMREEYYSAFLWVDGCHGLSTIRDMIKCFDNEGFSAPQHIVKIDDPNKKGTFTSLSMVTLKRVMSRISARSSNDR